MSGGRASVSTSTLTVGPHSITGTYNGNSNYNASTSSPVSLTVSQASSTTSLASNVNPSTLGQSVTFTATVLPSVATGAVQFFDVGNHSITATYGGDANDTGSTSSTLTQTVNPASAANFSLSATPASRTVVQGASTTYTATVSAVNGFAGTVSFSASGLPTGATFSFNPTSVNTSGSSTMMVTTASTTPTGSYTLTITGTSTSPSLTHSTTVTLVVNSFSISASPSSRTVTRGNSTTYTVTVAAINGFNGTVALRVRGLPFNSTATFNPSSVTGQGTSTMTVSTNTSTSTGTFTLRIRGTSGGVTHSTTAQLVVQ
ncbi:MAG: hypothetical protein DMG49_09175 [Acidobacteria bacterium]|nr:MAG: hypothetical protein DMG49_09175 [Acidobacteriota bacterium]